MPVESYLDTGDRTRSDGIGMIRPHPDVASRLAPNVAELWELKGAAPLVMAGTELAAARRKVMDHMPRRRSRPAELASQVG